MADRLERLLSELQDEVARRGPSEEEREKLAEWFGGVLQAERDRNAQNVNLLEMLQRGYDAGENQGGDDSPPAA